MGGHAGGEVAARVAVDALTAAFGRAAHRRRACRRRSPRPTPRSGSTATTTPSSAAWAPRSRPWPWSTTDGQDVLALVNVGDSRSYRFHDGELTQITADHSLAEEMVRRGELTEAEAAVHPHRHILTRALGVSSEVDVDLWRIRARARRPVPAVQRRADQRARRPTRSSRSSPRCADPHRRRRAAGPGGPHPRRQRQHHRGGGRRRRRRGRRAVEPAVAAVAADFRSGARAGDEEPPRPHEAATPGRRSAEPTVPAAASAAGRERRARRRAPGAPADHLPDASLHRPARRRPGRRLLRRPVVRHQLVLRGVAGRQQRKLVIYQGRVGGFLWYHPGVVERTGVTIADVPPTYVVQLQRRCGGVLRCRRPGPT